MAKVLLDVHTHTTFSCDARSNMEEQCAAAYQKGVSFYGISDHFDYGVIPHDQKMADDFAKMRANEEKYFRSARCAQEKYAGKMQILVGAEFGFGKAEETQQDYLQMYEKYRPDFIINSVHCVNKICLEHNAKYMDDACFNALRTIRESLDASYPYDIVGHIEYVIRYTKDHAPMTLEKYGDVLDDIFLTIIKKNKILEVNTATKALPQLTLPSERLLQRYYDLGGRNISFGSDAHETGRVLDKFDDVVRMLKKIGFTYFTVPCKGEYIQVEL